MGTWIWQIELHELKLQAVLELDEDDSGLRCTYRFTNKTGETKFEIGTHTCFHLYRENLRDFLPDKIIDIHAHSSHIPPSKKDGSPPSFWTEGVTFGCGMPLPNLLDVYLVPTLHKMKEKI